MLRLFGATHIDGLGPLRSKAQRTIVAALSLDLGTVVSADRLAELIWGDDQPENPAASLHNHVSRLRKILPADARLAAEGAGYRLVVDPGEVDVRAFDRGFDDACAAPVDARLEFIDRTLGLWRGEPFSDLDDDRALAEGARLGGRLAALREMRAHTLLAQGRHHEAIADLEQLRRTDPLRESTVELLMNAHADAGHKAEALAAYQDLRTALGQELGLDPSPALQELELAIITNERSALPSVPSEPAHPPQRSNLPTPASSFVGRREPMTQLTQLLTGHRLVSVIGPPGVGKTRLALQSAAAVADDFHGITWVGLASITDPASLGELVVGAMGLQPRGGMTHADRVIDAVGRRRHLLLLDNCEHMIDAVADLADAVLRGAPNLVVLATSREPLAIDGEHVLRLEPLEVRREAVELFMDRATAVASDFRLDEGDRELIEEICANLDGLPLAIELAASRCGIAGVRGLARDLHEPLALAAARRRAGEERHGSIRALVEWSARDLDPELASVFERCSVFAGWFTSADASEVSGLAEGAVSRALTELAERSLLITSVGRTVDGDLRYRYLATIRSCAREDARSNPAHTGLQTRYRQWGLALAEDSFAALAGADGDVADARMLAALDDFRVLHRHFMDSDDADGGLRLAVALDLVVMMHMRSEAVEWVLEVADRYGDTDHRATENAVALAAIAAWMSGDLERAAAYAAKAAEAADRSISPGAGMAASRAQGDVAQFRGENEAGFEHFRRAATLAEACGDALHRCTNLTDAATAAAILGDHDTARELIAEARAALHPNAATALHAWVSYAEGEALADADPHHALEVLSEALDLARDSDSPFISGVAGLTHAGLRVRTGAPTDAIAAVLDLMGLWRDSGAWVQQWITLRTVIDLFVRLGDHRRAAVVLGAVLHGPPYAEVSGPDQARLEEAHTIITEQLADAQAYLDQGAGTEPEELVDSVMSWLRSHAAKRSQDVPHLEESPD